MAESKTSRRRKSAAIFSVVIIISLSIFFAAYFHSLYGSSSNNLRLNVTLSSNSIVEGQNITISVEVFNSGNSVLGLPLDVHDYRFFYSKNFTYNNLSYMGPACLYLPFGLGEAAGDFQENNLSDATPLSAFPPEASLCQAELSHAFPPSAQVMPQSSNVHILYPFGTTTYSVMKGSIKVSGYWTNSDGNYTFHTFNPGTYTFVGEDGWGQVSVQHLTVKPAA